MRRIPTIPVIPRAVANVDGSGANIKAQRIRNAQSNVQIVMKTMWKPRKDMESRGKNNRQKSGCISLKITTRTSKHIALKH